MNLTAHPTSSRAGALAIEARRILSQELGRGDIYVSLPVPVLRGGVLAASFFAATTAPRADGTNDDMAPPAAELTLDWATGGQLELRHTPSPTGEPKTVAVRAMRFQEPMTPELQQQHELQKARLDGLLEVALTRYAANPQRPPMDDGTRYLEQWEDLVPRAARPYYTALNPDFFAWVEKGR